MISTLYGFQLRSHDGAALSAIALAPTCQLAAYTALNLVAEITVA